MDNMRKPYDIVMRALLSGLTVRLGDRDYQLDINDTPPLLCVRWLNSDNFTDSRLSVSKFLELCNAIPHEELLGIAADTALQEMANEQNAKRREHMRRLAEDPNYYKIDKSKDEYPVTFDEAFP